MERRVNYLQRLSIKLLIILVTAVVLAILCIGFKCERAVAAYDTTAPVVTDVTFTKSVKKPGIVYVTVEAVEEETGIIGIDVYFGNKSVLQPVVYHSGTWNNYANGEWEKNPRFSGSYTFAIPVSSKVRSGDWYLNQIDIADKAGNQRSYYGDDELAAISINNGDNSLVIDDEFDVDFQSYATNPNITSKLKSMPEGKTAMINFDASNHTMKKEWFDAIRGKNKSIVLANDAIQWHFNGKNVTSIKDIDCTVDLRLADTSFYGGSRQALEMAFASNGVLPGKAVVKVKSDYVQTLMGLSGKLYLYYVNDNRSLKLEDNPEHILDGTDHWCQFVVTHNSTFYVSGDKLRTAAPVPAAASTTKGVKISWAKVPGVRSYEVYRSTNGKKYKKVKTISEAATTSYTDKGAKVNGKKYFYKVKTTYRSGSKTKAATSKAVSCIFLSKPASVKATSVKNGKVKVTWSKNSKSSGYEVRCTGNGKTKVLTVNKKGITKKLVSKLAKGKTYKVQVRSFKKVGETRHFSPWSNVRKVKVR